MEGKGLLADIPTVVATREESGRVVAVGDAAKKMLGRAPEGIVTIYPIENGAVSDFHGAEIIISHLFHIALGRFLFAPKCSSQFRFQQQKSKEEH